MFSFIRLVAFSIIASVSIMRLKTKTYTKAVIIGDLFISASFIVSVSCYSFFGSNYQEIVNYLNTPATVIWALINYIDFLNCCKKP